MFTRLAASVAFFQRFVAGRYREHKFHNSSEALLAGHLKSRLKRPDYHLLNHSMLPFGEGTIEINHILVSHFGVFVLKTKDHGGWIFGVSTIGRGRR